MRATLGKLVLALALLSSQTAVRAQDPCDASVESKVPVGARSIWTGPGGGYYEKVGQALRYSALHDNLPIEPITSNGSVQNICALVQGKADFALVQSDAAHLAWYGERPFRKQYRDIQLVTPLFVEKVHILNRPHLYIPSPAGLTRPHSVWMGPENSGSELTAQFVLRASGKSQDEITSLKATPPPADFHEAMNRLKSWELDAIFQTEVSPAKDIADELKDSGSEIRLLGLDWPSVELLVRNGMYIETSLQKTEYSQLDNGIYTVGVEALLLTRSDVPNEVIAKLAEILHDRGDDILTHLQLILAKNSGIDVDPATDSRLSRAQSRKLIEPQSLSLLETQVPATLLVRAHPQAKGYLWTWRIPKEAAVRIGELTVGLIVICILMIHSGLRRRAGQNWKFVFFLVGYLVLFVIGGVSLQAIEGGLNQGFTTLWTSCVSLGEDILAKVLPIQAHTPTSQFGVTVMTWFSWALIGLFTLHIYPALKKILPKIWNSPFVQALIGNSPGHPTQ